MSQDRTQTTSATSQGQASGHDCQPELEQADLDCLEPGRPLNEKVIDTFFCLLAALFPYTIRVVGCASQASLSSSLDQVKPVTFATSGLTTLVPIHLCSSEPCVDHWLLAAGDSTGTRLWDSMPAEEHTQAATEILYRHQPHTRASIREVECPQTEGVDSGVAIIFNAICIVAATLGTTIQMPEISNASLWRGALTFMLRSSMGQSYRLCWGLPFENDTVLLESRDPQNDEWALLCSSNRIFISYEAARKAIQDQQQRLDAAAAVKNEHRVQIIRSGACIRDLLDSLSALTSSQRNQFDRLREENENLENGLRMLTAVDEYLLKVSAYATSPTASLQCEVRKHLRESSNRRERAELMVDTLNMTVEAVGEAVTMLQAGK
ncbi:hypothetical protein J7T55_005404 [Diaporthe amygdali]|uniref:uncharacterized protein n=1 Tax=Phomopsis amygdali TaxID=1214568 RepID=UPI0022FE2CC0|nr:uncharacterized protein J7T55_005404 [Diaporthe amygdali]KAJ0100664.1 hypothetical protein J7T55_005404 [Diaporthe amygdali]